MFIINIANPLTLVLIVFAVILLIFLGHETKKSLIASIPLFVFLILLIIHVAQVVNLKPEFIENATTLFRCITLDFIFILITFFAYLWVDDKEARANNIKSIDNSLDWFWRNI